MDPSERVVPQDPRATPPPACVNIARITEERVDLYWRSPTPPRRSIPVELDPFPIDDSVPEDEEVSGAVRQLLLNRAGGPYGMKSEYIWDWLRADTQEDYLDHSKWGIAVGLIKAVFFEGNLAEECAWQTVVLILKGNGDFCGICLVEVLWKTVPGILNRCLTTAIQFHDTLHGFRTGRGTGSASLQDKLLQQLMDLR